MNSTEFSKRMKGYELNGTQHKLIPNLPVMVRLDGKAFHSFCKRFDKPFDEGLISSMVETTKHLVDKTNALIGYTQSDEITLILNNDYNSPMMFGGKLYKLNSVFASMATAKFNDVIRKYKDVDNPAMFDCRVWNVPSKTEACNALLWREQDAVRNSIQMLGQSRFSHKQLHGKSCADIQDMLHEIDINWAELTPSKKRGTYVRRIVETRRLTKDEIAALPESHNARTNPDVEFCRSRIAEVEMPAFSKVVNRIEVVFDRHDVKCDRM